MHTPGREDAAPCTAIKPRDGENLSKLQQFFTILADARCGIRFAEKVRRNETLLFQNPFSRERFQGDAHMKRIFLLLLCMILLGEMIAPLVEAQERRRRSRFGRKARTAAIIAGGAGAGALIGGKKGAAIGAGGATLYAMNRRAARRNFKSRNRRIGTVLGGTALGAGVGGVVGGKKAAAIGAAAGAGGSYIYTKRSRSYQRRRRY